MIGKISKKKIKQVTILMYSVLFLFLLFTNPRQLPVLMLIIPVVWLFLCLTLSNFLLFESFKGSDDRGTRRLLTQSASIAAMICTVVLLRSVNQLNGRDLLLVLLFLIVASFYVVKFRIPKKS